MKLKAFFTDESGAISVEWTVLAAAIIGVGFVVGTQAFQGTAKVTDGYSDMTQPSGLITQFASNHSGQTPGAGSGNAPDGSGGGNSGGNGGGGGNSGGNPECVGNPGNDKCVGNAGENPNGKGGWGDGTRGMSQ